jgi:NodT family efflux transporter outer membrane factor (OMF) lipoprotein
MRRIACWWVIAWGGCTVGPDYEAPRLTLEASWHEGDALRSDPSTAKLAVWWKELGDPVLESLVDRAGQSNLRLRQAVERIEQFRALRASAMAGFYPSVDAQAQILTSRLSENGFLESIARGGAPALGAVLPGQHLNLYQLAFDASWEIDLWGKVRRSVEASEADLRGVVEGARDVEISLFAEVARGYIELRTYQGRLDVARRNLRSQEETLDVIRQRKLAGIASDLDLARAEAQVKSLQAALPDLDRSVGQTIHGLEFLLSLPPGSLRQELAPVRPIPTGPTEVPLGVPADLLRRRADLRRYERELAAQTARIGVATADLYPALTLTGAVGIQSLTPRSLFEWASRFWSAGPSFVVPLFQGGRLRARVALENSGAREALLRYEEAVLGAEREVENAILALARERTRRQALAERVDAERRAVRWAQDLYTNGVLECLSLLDAMRSLQAAEDELTSSTGALALHLVALYKALGGGWDSGAAEPSTD